MSAQEAKPPYRRRVTPALDEDVGRRIAAAIALRGESVAAVAEATGIHRQTVWRYSRGMVTHGFVLVALLAKHLKIRLDWLAFGTEPMQEGES
jgi:transcriptional regulator with XRE-family HTH domain